MLNSVPTGVTLFLEDKFQRGVLTVLVNKSAEQYLIHLYYTHCQR